MELKSNNPSRPTGVPTHVSVGIIAWNEEEAIEATIASLMAQTLFFELAHRNLCGEVMVIANGCTDGTCRVAQNAFERRMQNFAFRDALSWKVENLVERGKLKAWNEFVHRFASPEAGFLILLDADISFDEPETLWNMVEALHDNADASVSVDLPRKRHSAGSGNRVKEALSKSAARVTAAAPAQLCGQAYCIRAEVARNIYMPKDLTACDDGFIKALVCTDMLTGSLRPERICLAPKAGHTFEAYTSPMTVLKNQKRQIIGQTMAHLLIDKHLPRLTLSEKIKMGETLRKQDDSDPAWLKRLIAEHVARTRLPWKLYPNLLTHRFRQVRRLSPLRQLACLPGLVAGTGVSLVASCLAFRSLKRGCTDYWPKASRTGFRDSGGPLEHGKLNTTLIQ